MTQLRAPLGVAWLPWGAVAFRRAREEQKVVLLSIATPWSGACREMDRQCYGDPVIAGEINRWFIPVRVDADRRPDVADRYDLGGLPTTAFLTAEGTVIGGGTFVPPARLLEAFARLRQPMPAGRPVSAATREGAREADATPEQLTGIVFGNFDELHAGFGTQPKFPLVAPVRLALDLFRESQSEAMASYATRTLDAMAQDGLYDQQGGGFFRCAARADWQEPQPEKLLATNAALLNLYLEAGVTLDRERWLERGADVLAFVQRTLAVAPGKGWRNSEQSDDTGFSDSNAIMVSAALHASGVFDDSQLREHALDALEAVLLASYRPGKGVAHCPGGVRGLLADHVAMTAAHLDAWDVTGDVVYQMMAQELVQYMLRVMWHPNGGFVDRSTLGDDDEELLGEPLRPFVLNCEAAEVLHRLATAAGDPRFDTFASRTLESVRRRAAAQGPLAAHYLLASRSITR